MLAHAAGDRSAACALHPKLTAPRAYSHNMSKKLHMVWCLGRKITMSHSFVRERLTSDSEAQIASAASAAVAAKTEAEPVNLMVQASSVQACTG